MHWDDIRIFLEVAEAGSLTVAARQTGLSQPTISRHLKAMEEAAGGALFERLPNRIELTPLGKELIESATSMKAGAESVRRKAELFMRGRSQAIRISTTMSVSYFLCQHLNGLAQVAASCGGELHIEPTREALNFAFRQTDLAVRLRAYPEHGPAKVRRIGRMSCAVYGRRGTNALQRGVIGLTRNRPPPQPEWLDRFAEDRKSPMVARLGEFFQRYAAVKVGLGVSLLPCFLGDTDADLERLGEVPRELDEDAFLLFHPDLSDAPAVRAVAEGITELFAAHRLVLCGEAQTVHPPA